MATILCVDGEQSGGLRVQDALERAGHRVVGARTVPQALQALQALAGHAPDLIVSHCGMPGLGGLELLDLLRQERCATPVILHSGDADHAVAAMKAGAEDCISPPVTAERIELAVRRALAVLEIKREHEALRRELAAMRAEREVVGDGAAMRAVLEAAIAAAATRASVLIEGEGGTGKELLARTIHAASDRGTRPFIKVNCAALPDSLVESALFGHEKGAFARAAGRADGAFERADGGTLLLDEVCGLRGALQEKLTQVLRRQELERVGGSQRIRVDVRIVATASSGLESTELLDCLGATRVRIPPLRERKEDIPALAFHFASRRARELSRPFEGLAPDVMPMLRSYDWPGNVRELRHVVERAVMMSPNPLLQPLAFEGMHQAVAARASGAAPPVRASQAVAVEERAEGGHAIVLTSLDVQAAEAVLIQKALEATRGNRTRAAELLGMSVRTLRNKLNGPVTAVAER